MKRSLLSITALLLSILLVACGSSAGAGSGGDTSTGGTDTGSTSSADGSATVDTGPGPDVCQLTCGTNVCGDDGCGGTCGTCANGTMCTNGQCVPDGGCTPEMVAANCADKTCGPDGCGSLCGNCQTDQMCHAITSTCVCAPACDVRECGSDNVCGLSCGDCADGFACNEAGTCIADYPPGPYGTRVGDTIANLTFLTNTGRSVSLKSFYGQEKVMVITSAAGWCTACQAEAQEFVDFNALYDDRGLILFYTLYEDDRGNPIDADYVDHWIEWLELDYPVYQDADFALQPYYTENATPLNMVVTTEDMQIRYQEVGFSEFQVLYWAKKYMFEGND